MSAPGPKPRLTRRSFVARIVIVSAAGGVHHSKGQSRNSMKKIIRPARAAAPVGPYSHAVRVGNLLYCSGQIPLDPSSGQLVAGDIKAQTERVLENIRLILDDQGLTFAGVVKSTVFMTNLGDFAGMNEVYARYFAGDFPARSTVQVAALPRGAAVEIEIIATFE
jgi:2-iminobutanoate/2-iminopropanoate deaminase